MATISKIKLVSVDSSRPLKVITPHFHFDSDTKKKTHPAIELLIVESLYNICLDFVLGNDNKKQRVTVTLADLEIL